MSTHSVIGVELPNGKIIGSYVHYDGHPDTMIPRLQHFITTQTTTSLVVLLLRGSIKGGIRSFHNCSAWDEDGERKTDFLDDDYNLKAIDEHNFNDDHYGTYAWYLVDYKTGEISVRECYPENRAECTA
jgi:hypothetical protein